MEAEAREAMLKEFVEVLDARSSGAATHAADLGRVCGAKAGEHCVETPGQRKADEATRRGVSAANNEEPRNGEAGDAVRHDFRRPRGLRFVRHARDLRRRRVSPHPRGVAGHGGAVAAVETGANTLPTTRPDKFQPATLLRIQEAFKSLVAAAAKHGTQHVCMVYSSEWDVVATAVGGADTGYTLRGAVKGETGPRFALDHCVTQAIAAVASAQFEEGVPVSKRRKADQYLLTGYNVFCTEEPCVMCVMSLLHSRCGALYYLKKNTKFGGAGGLHCVHSEEKLNHHFPAYCYSNTELCAALEGA